jgi:hypothetical protein
MACAIPATVQSEVGLQPCAGFGLKQGEEIDRAHVALILASFGIGELALVALSGQFVDPSPGLPIEAEADQSFRDFGRKDTPEIVEQPVQDRSVRGFHFAIVSREQEHDVANADPIEPVVPQELSAFRKAVTTPFLESVHDVAKYPRILTPP